MVGWHHRLIEYEFEKILGVGDGQWGLACCNPWARKESDTTERLNWTERSRTYTGLGKQTLDGHKQNIVCTRTHKKGAVTPQETKPDLPMSVQETPVEVLAIACCRVRGTECSSTAPICLLKSILKGSPTLHFRKLPGPIPIFLKSSVSKLTHTSFHYVSRKCLSGDSMGLNLL